MDNSDKPGPCEQRIRDENLFLGLLAGVATMAVIGLIAFIVGKFV